MSFQSALETPAASFSGSNPASGNSFFLGFVADAGMSFSSVRFDNGPGFDTIGFDNLQFVTANVTGGPGTPTVPEPASLLIAGLTGLGLCGGAARKRRAA